MFRFASCRPDGRCAGSAHNPSWGARAVIRYGWTPCRLNAPRGALWARTGSRLTCPTGHRQDSRTGRDTAGEPVRPGGVAEPAGRLTTSYLRNSTAGTLRPFRQCVDPTGIHRQDALAGRKGPVACLSVREIHGGRPSRKGGGSLPAGSSSPVQWKPPRQALSALRRTMRPERFRFASLVNATWRRGRKIYCCRHWRQRTG